MSYIFDIVFYASFISAGTSALFGLKLIRIRPINMLVLLVSISFLADVINAISSFYYLEFKIDLGIRSVGAAYRILEFLIIVLFFRAFDYSVTLKNVLTLLSSVLVIYFISIQEDFFNIRVDSTIMRVSSACLVILFGMLFYKSIITKMEVPNIEKWPPFYLISALFIYFSGVLMALILQRPITKIDLQVGSYLLMFHNILLIVRNVLLIVGFYYTYKTKYKWEHISLV
ncbi:hypothetical protein [Fulvivirga sp.]|uniref:hypothetical protein n=1 Tax=Fulvivirga sp. TaxID=1931237 RepID=UPI0032ECAFAA